MLQVAKKDTHESKEKDQDTSNHSAPPFVFITLLSIEDFTRFWEANREHYECIWEGDGTGDMALNDCEWLFGKTSRDIVLAVQNRIDSNPDTKGRILWQDFKPGVRYHLRHQIDEMVANWKEIGARSI